MLIKPSTIRLDVSTICQLKCPTCPTTRGIIANTLGSKILKFEDFKKIITANPWITDIELSNWGEIFLNRDLIKIIQFAHENKISLRANNGVNLNTVNEEVLESLVKYQFLSLSCSIDGASQEVYKIYRQGGDFDKVIANIKKINAYKVKYKSDLPQLRWQFVAFGHNEHEIPQAKQMAKELGMAFHLKLSWDESFPVINKELIREECGAADRKEYQLKFGYDYLAPLMCAQMWKRPQINTDGRVLGCCENYWGDYGNVFLEDLVSILNNEKMNYARDMLLGKKEAREDVPCTQCKYYQNMKRNNRWLVL